MRLFMREFRLEAWEEGREEKELESGEGEGWGCWGEIMLRVDCTGEKIRGSLGKKEGPGPHRQLNVSQLLVSSEESPP